MLEKGQTIYIPLPKGQKALISAKFLAIPGPFRAAAIAPKSVAKRAVERNKLRRAVYRAIAGLPSPTKGGIALFFVKNIPPKLLTPAFAEEIALIFEKISSR